MSQTQYCVHLHCAWAVAVIEVYRNGFSLGCFCEDHAIAHFEDVHASFRTL